MEQLLKTIKLNCHISDARYWGYFSICGLLMRMRDLYRSENGLKPWHPISKEKVAQWISEREALWKELEERSFTPLPIDEELYSPFDVEGINLHLNPSGYVYGAGYGLYMKPTFFIAEINSKKDISDYTVYISKKELARDLFASSAMLQGRCIFIRLEPLRTLLWEKLTSLRSGQKPHIEKAFLRFGLSPSNTQTIDEDTLEIRIDEMVFKYSEMILYHELAEAMEDIPDWNELIVHLKDRNLELMLRALKDLIADTSEHGPIKRALEKNDLDILRLYINFMEGYRTVLYPSILEIADTEDQARIEDTRIRAYRILNSYRENILNLYLKGRADEIKRFLGEISGKSNS